MYIIQLRFLITFSVFAKYLAETLNSLKINVESIPRVVSGWPGRLGDVPYQIAFKGAVSRHTNLYMTFCGGTIVGETKLVSAAHCFVPDRSACMKLFIKVGHIPEKELRHKYAVAGTLYNKGHKPLSDNTTEGQWRRLKDVYYPIGYKFPKKDIAVVMTTEPFNFNNHVNFIPIARKFADYKGKCLVSGYGRISNVGMAKSDKLLLAHLQIVPLALCSLQHRKNMHSFVCTSSKVTDVGKGDSGGPLVCMGTGDAHAGSKGVLIGVVSGHRYRVGSFFTRVSLYHSFILKNKSCSYNNNNLPYVCLTLILKIFLPF